MKNLRVKEEELAYFAGIFDGEGSISMSHDHQEPTYYLQAVVVSTNEWIIRHLQFTFGGSIQHCQSSFINNSKEKWSWVASAKTACAFLKYLLPYLHIKRSQAELAIMFQNHKSKPGRGKHHPGEYIKFEEDIKQSLSKLNKRGIK